MYVFFKTKEIEFSVENIIAVIGKGTLTSSGQHSVLSTGKKKKEFHDKKRRNFFLLEKKQFRTSFLFFGLNSLGILFWNSEGIGFDSASQ